MVNNYIYTNLVNQASKQFTIFSVPKPFDGHMGVIHRDRRRFYDRFTVGVLALIRTHATYNKSLLNSYIIFYTS